MQRSVAWVDDFNCFHDIHTRESGIHLCNSSSDETSHNILVSTSLIHFRLLQKFLVFFAEIKFASRFKAMKGWDRLPTRKFIIIFRRKTVDIKEQAPLKE